MERRNESKAASGEFAAGGGPGSASKCLPRGMEQAGGVT